MKQIGSVKLIVNSWLFK